MDDTSNPTKRFFSSLSERMYNENRLSDITWVMCQVSDDFKFLFVKFFFEDIKKEDCREIEIEREKQQDIGRPDFYFEFDNKVFLIENKIKDPNHHFHQYLKTCKEPSYLGYITNYVIKDEDDINDNGNIIKWKELYNEGFRVHTWEEFCDYMKICMKNYSNTLNEEERSFWEGYLEYVKKVCSILKINKVMKIDGLYSLYSLMTILEKLCREGKGNNYSLSLGKEATMNTTKCQRGISGFNFALVYDTYCCEEIWGWIGIYYYMEKPEIWMGFSNDWGKKYIDMLDRNNLSAGQTFEKPRSDSEALWFKLNEKQMELFENATKVEEQEDILRNFMDEVINYPGVHNKKAQRLFVKTQSE